MKKQIIGASPEPTVALENIHSEDRLSQLYLNSFTTLQNAAFERFPDGQLLPWDAHDAMAAVHRRLAEFTGPIDDDGVSFEKWATRITIQEAFRYICLRLAMGEYKRMILATITKEMWTSAEDCSVSADDLFSEVLMLIFNMSPKFLHRKQAKLSTRLCALAKKHVYFYFNKKNKKRLAAVSRQMADDSPKGGLHGVEILSALEQASINADLIGDGYREAGLHLA